MKSANLGQVYYPKTPLVKPSINQATSKISSPAPQVKGAAFAQLLDQTLSKNKLKFSQHAQDRLLERGIDLSVEQMERLHQGLAKAKGKGARESLFLMEDLAFVVSVKNETVITAMGKEQMSEHIITNIDSAVFL